MTTQHDDDQRRGGFRDAVNELFGRGERDPRDTSQLDALDRDEAQRHGEAVDSDDPTAQAGGARQAYDSQATAADQDRYGDARAGDPDQPTTPGVRYDAGDPAATDPAAQQTMGAHPGETAAGQATADARRDPVADDVAGGQAASAGRYDDTVADDRQVDPLAQHTATEGHLGEPRTPQGGEVRGDTVAPERVHEGGDPTAQGQAQHGGELRGDPGLPSTDTRSDADLGAGTSARDAGVGDTAGAGAVTGSAATSATGTARHDAPADSDGEERAALVTRDRADSYSARWDSVKGEFVDEPRRAVADADALVGELLDELQELFKQQRTQIEQGLDRDETSTEDLRVALRRYRSFFDRLLSI